MYLSVRQCVHRSNVTDWLSRRDIISANNRQSTSLKRPTGGEGGGGYRARALTGSGGVKQGLNHQVEIESIVLYGSKGPVR